MWPKWQLIMPSTLLLLSYKLAALSLDSEQQAVPATANYSRVFRHILSQLEWLELHLPAAHDHEHQFVQFLLRQHQCPLLLTSAADFGPTSRHHFRLYGSLEQLQQRLPRLDNQGGFYILALAQSPVEAELLQFMARLWRLRGHNRIYYVLPAARILLYNPFSRSLLDVNAPDSYEHIYDNLQGYALRCYIFDSVYSAVFGNATTRRVELVTGADAKVARTVAQHLNFRLDYQWPDDEFFGGRLENGSFNGGLGRMVRQELDIIFAGFFVKDYLTQDIEFSAAVYMDELCLYVQKAKRIPQSILPLFAVHIDVWLCFLLVGFGSALVWLCMRSLNLCLHIRRIDSQRQADQENRYSMALRIFVETWVVWVRVNVGQFPPFHSERIFLVSLCLVSVIFGAMLESSLATVYIRPLYYRDIETLLELDATPYPIYIKHSAFRDDLFQGHDSAVYRRLQTRLKLVGEGEERLIRIVARRGGVAGVTRAASLQLRDSYYVMTKQVHKIPECPKNYHIAYMLARNSPYTDPVNAIVMRISAAGLIELWTSEMKERAKWSMHKYPEYLADLDRAHSKVLTLADVQLAFHALSLGCLLALLVWLLELRCPKLFRFN